MKSIYDGYQTIGKGEQEFFIGANTGRGFVNSSADVFSETVLDHLYILKGGAGTGKSTLLKKLSKEAAKHGCAVTLYRCGSDYESLDGVILEGKIGVVDGTSPHVWEMKYPRACSCLVDVSKYLNSEGIATRKAELEELTQRKTEAYASAYRYLRGAECLDCEITETIEKAADFDKLCSYAERTAKKFSGKENGAGTVRSVYVGSVSMRGLALLPTLREEADCVISVSDVFGFASVFLRELGSAFSRRGQSVVYGKIPLNDKIRQLYLPDLGLLFDVNGEGSKRINTERFLYKERYAAETGRMKLTQKCIRSLQEEAVNCLQAAGEAHFGLEEINRGCMDFKGLNRYGNQIIAEIMSKLTTS